MVTVTAYPVVLLLFHSIMFASAFRILPRGTPKSQFPLRLLGSTVAPAAKSALPLSFDRLAEVLQGNGKAKMVWEQLRESGMDPLSEKSVISGKAKELLRKHALSTGTTSSSIDSVLIPAVIDSESVAFCGTRKMLLKLSDNQSIETVIIPAHRNDHSTLCVSTQLGCDRRCAFCATGTMGLLRNLSGDEIIAQVIRTIAVAHREGMPRITNVVFMGMGDSAGNLPAVREAVECLTDPKRLAFSANKICVSTVGPNPECFMQLAAMPATFAWSLHSPDNNIRKLLVPSTRHTTEELREGVIQALLSRENPRSRTLLVAFTLIAGVNDALSDAEKVYDFLQPVVAATTKLVVNLIPYNDIQQSENVAQNRIAKSAIGFHRPSNESVRAFQSYLRERGLFCSVRSTRGEDEAAACGMLATKRQRRTVMTGSEAAAVTAQVPVLTPRCEYIKG